MRIIAAVLGLLMTQAAFAVEGVQIHYRGEAFVASSKQFYVEYCADSKCQEKIVLSVDEKKSNEVLKLVVDEVARDIRRGIYRRGYEIDNWGVGPMSEQELFELLRTDYSQGDGDFAWPEGEIQKVADYLKRFSGNVQLYRMQVMSNYMSGTGIESFYILYNTKTNWATVITRLEYAE